MNSAKHDSLLRAVIYSRVSTDAQERDGTSLDTQENACAEYAQSKGWIKVESIRDTASGANLDRPGMDRVRELLRHGLVDVVLSYAVDRLSRNQIHVAVLLDNIEKVGASLEFVTESFENTAVGRLILNVRAFSGEVEREKIAERTMRGKEARAKSGRIPQATGKGIYGYSYDRETGRRVIIPEQAKTVQRIFNDFLLYRSCNRVTTELNRDEIPSFGGGQWHPLTVRRILGNQTYTGRTIYRKTKAEKIFNPRTGKKSRRVITRDQKDWIEIPDATPRIISLETYEVTQKVLDDPNRNSRRENGSYNLTGRIKCSLCSTPMVGHSQSKGKYKYYRCRRSYSGHREGTCESRYINQELLETTVMEQLANVLSDPDVILSEMHKYNAGLVENPGALDQIISELKSLSVKESRLAHLFVEGTISGKILSKEEKILKNKKSDLLKEKELHERNSDQSLDLDKVTEQLPLATNLIRTWIENAEGENTALLLDALDVHIRASKTGIQIRGNMPIVTEKDENFVTIARTSA